MQDDTPYEADETIQNLSTGVELKAKMKRGTGTRDQDTIVAKIKGETTEEVEEKREEMVEAMKETAEELREIQPEGEEE